MRRITFWLASTVTALVLVFSYHTSTGTTPLAEVVAAEPVNAPAAVQSAATPSTDTQPQTVTGSSVDTRWGPVQVQITVSSGRITGSTAVVSPDGNNKDVQINARALPVLDGEVLTAQSANIDMVSGATVTSEGYVQSLQSAIDQVKLG